MSNRFLISLLVLVALIAGVFVITKNKSNSSQQKTTTNVQPTNHTEGEGKSGVVLIEYGDYQCPACGAYYPIVKQVVEKYKDQITFQFRNFPLISIHPNAIAGARAAEAADKQGKFWEMHDLLYENQQSWGASSSPSSFFEAYARQLGLNADQFKADSAGSGTNDLVRADIQEGNKIGATSTPTFVLDGKKLDQNPRSLDEFNKLIEDAIKAKTGTQ